LNNLRNLALWALIAVLLVVLFNLFQGSTQHQNARAINFTEFNQQVADGNVKDVTIQNDEIDGHFQNGSTFTTYQPNDPNLVSKLLTKNVQINAKPRDDGSLNLMSIFINWFPMLLLIGVWVFFLRQMQSGGGKAMVCGCSSCARCSPAAARRWASARAVRRCSPSVRAGSRLKMSPVSMKPRKT
jgi:cell division protease FtsH